MHDDMPKVLLIRPLSKDFDIFETLSYSIGLLLKEEILKANYRVVDFAADNATRENFENAFDQYTNIQYVIYLGHGSSEGKYTADSSFKVIIDENNIDLLCGKRCFFACCHVGLYLGPMAVKKGAEFFIGYNEKFYLAGFGAESTIARCTISAIVALMKGSTLNQAIELMIKEHTDWYYQLLRLRDNIDPNWVATAGVLRHNLKSLTVEGVN